MVFILQFVNVVITLIDLQILNHPCIPGIKSHLIMVCDPFNVLLRDFLGGAVVKNPPANARDTGSSPGPGRSHMPWSNKARVPQLLNLRSRACEPQLVSPRTTTTEARAPRACAPQQEKPPQ